MGCGSAGVAVADAVVDCIGVGRAVIGLLCQCGFDLWGRIVLLQAAVDLDRGWGGVDAGSDSGAVANLAAGCSLGGGVCGDGVVGFVDSGIGIFGQWGSAVDPGRSDSDSAVRIFEAIVGTAFSASSRAVG